ncbi:MAG: ABC transporter permease [Lachnospiraceae bacterium]|nr:ABC transporter permease [Lachnospiraceae bacterium]
MGSLWFIAKNNMKKRKGAAIVLLFLMALVALLLYVSISVLTGTEKVIDEAYEAMHTPDWFYMTNIDCEERLTALVADLEEVEEFEVGDGLYVVGGKCRKDLETEADEYGFLFGTMEEERTIGKIPVVENPSYDAILLPYYLKYSEGYKIGDFIWLQFYEKEYRFCVAGFVNDPLFANPTNISVYSCYITDACMKDILEEEPVLAGYRQRQYRARLVEGSDAWKFDEKVSLILTKEIPELADGMNLGLNWTAMSHGVSIVSNISMGIILLFSVLLLVVAVIIIRFSVQNFVELNLKNIGILKASGYTSRQLRSSLLLEMAALALFGSMLGLLAGALGGRFIGSLEGMMLGLSWKFVFAPQAAGVSLLVVLGAVCLTAFLSGRVYRKVTVLDALRGGVHTHNFKKNYFPLHTCGLPQSLALAGKNILGEKRKNLSVLCIVALQALVTIIGFALYENFAASQEKLMKMSGMEMGDAYVTGKNLDEAGSRMEDWEEIEKVLYYNNCSVRLYSGDEQISLSSDIYRTPQDIENELLIEGRLPVYDNEIVLTTMVAERLSVGVGDVIYVEGGGERKDYMISGVDQKFNNAGIKAMMTWEGAERLNGETAAVTLHLYLKEGVSFADIQEKLSEEFPNLDVSEGAKLVEHSLGMIRFSMQLICLIFVAITVVVVVMVELLLVKSKITKEQKNYGIHKALGYTTAQLIGHTLLVNMPVIFAGSVLGIVLGRGMINPLVSAFLSGFGIKKCEMAIAPVWLLVTAFGIVAVAAISCLISAARIRRIEPVKMLSED